MAVDLSGVSSFDSVMHGVAQAEVLRASNNDDIVHPQYKDLTTGSVIDVCCNHCPVLGAEMTTAAAGDAFDTVISDAGAKKLKTITEQAAADLKKLLKPVKGNQKDQVTVADSIGTDFGARSARYLVGHAMQQPDELCILRLEDESGIFFLRSDVRC